MAPALPTTDERVPAVVVDALLGTAVALAIALILAADQAGGRASPDPGAYLFALGFGALMLLRRRAPRTVLVLTVLGLFAYYALDHPPIGVAVPVVTALFAAADAGLLAWAIGSGAVVLVVSFVFRVREGEALGFLLGYEAVSNIALIAAATALGYSFHSHRLRTSLQAEITRLTTQQLEREAEWRVQHERERISRDLHDTVGHTLSVISVHAGVAEDALDGATPDTAAASEAVGLIRRTSTRSLQDLRTMVRLLRTPAGRDAVGDAVGDAVSDDATAVLSLASVPDLAATVEGVGLQVTTRVDADPGELSPQVDATAYRVVQEALTNVVKHAGARRVDVSAQVRDGVLHLRVADDGRGAPRGPAAPGGHGLAGMTERVRLLGGALRTRSGEGFHVEAELPARLQP